MRKGARRGVAFTPDSAGKASYRWSNNFAAVGASVPLPDGNILQQDSVSFIMQEDGASKIITEA